MSRFLVVSSMMALAAGCTSPADPFAHEGDAPVSPGTDAAIDAPSIVPDAIEGPQPDGGNTGVRCPPVPARMVVLGDSITACDVVGGKDSADCVSKQVFDYLKATYAPDVTYVNVAVGGSQTKHVIHDQLANVPGGPGHVLVLIYIGGNDLSPYMFRSDAVAEAAFAKIIPEIQQHWADLFRFFEDKTRFPDGATIVMNNQYDPFDDCTAAPFYLTPKKIQLLHRYNAELRSIANGKAQSTIIIDQHTPFLGHGHHYDVPTCPFYKPGLQGFMKDLIHADGPGNAHLASFIDKGLDQMFADCSR